MTDHPQVEVVYGRRIIRVDAGMVELLAALWAAQVDTQYSCQGGPPPEGGDSLAYIAFPAQADHDRFAGAVTDLRQAEWEWVASTEWGPAGVRFPPCDIPLIINTFRQ